MDRFRRLTPINWALMFLVVLSLFFLGKFISDQYIVLLENESRESYISFLRARGESVRVELQKQISLLNGLEKFVMSRDDRGIDRDFSVFASGLYNDTRGIKNVIVAPKGMVKYYYPLEGNIGGSDLTNDPRQEVNKDVKTALETGIITYSGPLQLTQGGLGLVARKAIYKNNKFWGLVSVAIDVPVVLESTGIDPVIDGKRLVLRDGGGDVFWGDEKVLLDRPAIYKIPLADSYWELAAVPLNGWMDAMSPKLIILWVCEVLIGIQILIIIHILLKKDRGRLAESNNYFKKKSNFIWVVLVYLVFGSLWIIASDQILSILVPDVKTNLTYQTYKGWFFILITALYLFILLRQSNRKYSLTKKALSATLQGTKVMFSSTDEEMLLNNICEVIVKDGGYLMAWVGIKELDSGKTVIPKAMAGRFFGYFDNKKITWTDDEFGEGPTSRAIKSGKTLVIDNVGVADDKLWAKEAIKRGFKSAISAPMIYQNEVVGALNVYSGETESFGQGEIELFSGLANDLAFSIQNLRIRRQRDINLEKFNKVVEYSPLAVVLINNEGAIYFANEEAVSVLGLSKSSILQSHFDSPVWKVKTLSGELLKKDELPVSIVLKTRAVVRNYIHSIEWPNGETVYLSVSAAPIKNINGELEGVVAIFDNITNDIKNEEIIRSSEEKYKSLFTNMTNGFALHKIVLDKNGKPENYRYIEVNDQFEKMTGIGKSSLGKLVTEVLPNIKEDTVNWVEVFGKVALGGKPLETESFTEAIGKWYLIRAYSPMKEYFAVVIEDITERKKVEERLKNLASFPRLNPNSIIQINKDGEITYTNPAYQKVVKSLGKDIYCLLPDNIREIIVDLVNNKEKIIETEKTIGGNIYLLTIYFVSESNDIRIYAVDITAKVKSEKKLAVVNKAILTEKQKLERVLENMGDGVLVTDEDKNIVLVNSSMQDFCGVLEVDLLNKKANEVIKIFYEDKLDVPSELYDIVYREKKSFEPVEKLVIENINGKKLIVDGVVSPMKNEVGDLIGAVWVFRDITKERGLEKMKSDFVSMASHQLRTPLTGIKWFVELLSENVDKMGIEDIKMYLEKIGDSNVRLIKLVNDLLATSRVEGGKFNDKEVMSVSLRKLINESVEPQETIYLRKNIKIVGISDIPEDIMIETDVFQMSQVLINLINNAISYSPNGSTITIGVHLNDSSVTLSVKDKGYGIPESQKNRIFEKFFRADNVSRHIPGSGLGLYVSKSIIEYLGGKIWFESEENKGSTFYIEIPLHINRK